MRLSTGIDKEPTLQRSVFLSSLLHLFIILFTIIPLRTGDREFRHYYVRIVSPMELARQGGQGLSRTRRAIPRKRIPPPKSRFRRKRVIPKKTIKTHAVKESKTALKAEEIIAKEIERLRAIKEIERHRMKREEVEIIRESVGSASAVEDGTAGEAKGVDADSYYGRVIEMISDQWAWPPEIGSLDLEVIISIRIDGRGNIVSQEIEKSSGNLQFDQSALRAISKANPLPPPPFGIETEIGVRFRL
jgi:TonB family protein